MAMLQQIVCRPFTKQGKLHVEFTFKNDDGTVMKITREIVLAKYIVFQTVRTEECIKCLVYRSPQLKQLILSVRLRFGKESRTFWQEIDKGTFTIEYDLMRLN